MTAPWRHHRVLLGRVADPEPGELQDQAPEVLGEPGEVAAVVAPARHTGTGPVQQQRRRALAGLVVAQDALVGGELPQRRLVSQLGRHDLPVLRRWLDVNVILVGARSPGGSRSAGRPSRPGFPGPVRRALPLNGIGARRPSGPCLRFRHIGHLTGSASTPLIGQCRLLGIVGGHVVVELLVVEQGPRPAEPEVNRCQPSQRSPQTPAARRPTPPPRIRRSSGERWRVRHRGHRDHRPQRRGPVGFACQSFASVSLDPPLILFCADKRGRSWPRIRAAGHFCVNVLGEEQRELCERFGPAGARSSSWTGRSPLGAPVLPDVLLAVHAVVHDVHE